MMDKFGSVREMVENALVMANEAGFGEATAVILKYRQKKEDIRKTRYSF